MNSWSWFKTYGDDFFVFVSLVAVALQGDPQIPASVLHWIVDLGVIAGIGHKVFWPGRPFPNPTGAT
jgi:hypothetical protein